MVKLTRRKQITGFSKHPFQEHLFSHSQRLQHFIKRAKKQFFIFCNIDPGGIGRTGQIPCADALYPIPILDWRAERGILQWEV